MAQQQQRVAAQYATRINTRWTASSYICSFALALVLLIGQTAADEMLGFFGQTPKADASLQSMCDRGIYTMIAVSFVNTFGYLPLHIDLGQYQCDVPPAEGLSTSGCQQIANDIAYCQSKGIKMLLAMGGCVDTSCGGNYMFQTAQQANDTANAVWGTYLSPNNNASASAGSTSRPFGTAQFDGIVLDVENDTPANPDQSWYNVLVAQLQQYNPSLLIVGTPECRLGRADTRNPMESMVSNVPFDYLMPQFYNDQLCSLKGKEFESTLQQWMNLENSAINSTQILIGAPGDKDAYVKNSGSVLLSGGQLGALVNSYRNTTARNPVVGVGIWAAQSDGKLYNDLNSKLSTPWDTSDALPKYHKSLCLFLIAVIALISNLNL